MVESIEALRKICQKPNYKKVGNWMVRHITRDMALYFTWIILRTPLNSDQVVFISIGIALLGFICILSLGPWIFILGVLLLQLWYVFDHVDGQIARYRKEADLTGNFFDYIMHYIVHSAFFFFLGIRAYREFGNIFIVFLAFFTAFSMALLSLYFDCKYKVFCAKLDSWKGKTLLVNMPANNLSKAESFFLKRGFMFFYKLCEIHVILNLISLVALINIFVSKISLFNISLTLPTVFFFFYSFLLPFVFITRLAYALKNNQIDQDFNLAFSVLETEGQQFSKKINEH